MQKYEINREGWAEVRRLLRADISFAPFLDLAELDFSSNAWKRMILNEKI